MKKNDGLFYAEGPGYSRGSNKFSHNQYSGHSNDGRTVNKGRGPTVGNQDHKPMNVGPSATKDKFKPAPTASNPGVHQGKDMFTGKAQVRTPGGTRSWDPQKGQNYKGNPDRINVSGYTMGDGQMTKGKNPVSKPDPDTMNYGPKKQY